VIILGTAAALLVGCGAANSEASVNVSSAEDVQRISPAEAKALLDSGEAVLYDTRSADAYQAQHAKGAVSFPEEEAAARIDQLPDDGTAVILYCT
jgi:rhodanese-related sulfurtransferase